MGVVLYGSCGAFRACFLTIFQTLVIKVEHSLTIFLLKQNYVPCILQLTMIYNRKGDLFCNFVLFFQARSFICSL